MSVWLDLKGALRSCGSNCEPRWKPNVETVLFTSVDQTAGVTLNLGEGETREAYDVVAGPSLDHIDDVERWMGHQTVVSVTKILNTNEAILTESGRRESLKEYFILREKAVLAPMELDSIESDTPLPEID